LPWAHLDITGPAWNTGAPRGHTPKGATGAGVATLLAAIESIASPA
jgi:leucyl aminopeptidase